MDEQRAVNCRSFLGFNWAADTLMQSHTPTIVLLFQLNRFLCEDDICSLNSFNPFKNQKWLGYFHTDKNWQLTAINNRFFPCSSVKVTIHLQAVYFQSGAIFEKHCLLVQCSNPSPCQQRYVWLFTLYAPLWFTDVIIGQYGCNPPKGYTVHTVYNISNYHFLNFCAVSKQINYHPVLCQSICVFEA